MLISLINWEKYDESTGVPSLSKTNILNVVTYIRSLQEQEKIGDLFEKIERAIELQEEIAEENKNYKKSMLHKMFPKEGKDKPEIRFEGFEDKW